MINLNRKIHPPFLATANNNKNRHIGQIFRHFYLFSFLNCSKLKMNQFPNEINLHHSISLFLFFFCSVAEQHLAHISGVNVR